MKYWNSTLRSMDEYIPGEQPQNLDTYIKLNTNENPFPPSKAAVEAITKATTEKLRRYPSSSAMEVREIFAEANGISAGNVFMGNGSDEIFTLIFRGFIEKTGLAAFPYPSYSLYDTLAQGNGIAFEKIPLNEDFSYDLKKFLEKKYDLVIIANPNNPTGTYCPVEKIADFLRSYEGLMVVDEAYIDFYGGSALGLIKEFDNVIVTRSFSKSYSLAGLRAGLAVACEDIISGLMKIKDSYNMDMLALAGTAAALKDTKTFRYNIDMLISNKEYLEERLAEMGFSVVPSRANFLFVKHESVPAGEIYEKLKERKILVRHFSGEIQSEYIRITVGTMMEMKTLCKELQAIVTE